MSFLSLTGVELKKIRRSGILWILVIPVFLIWLTSVINADINFTSPVQPLRPILRIMILCCLSLTY